MDALLDDEKVAPLLEPARLPDGLSESEAEQAMLELAQELRRTTVTDRGLPAPENQNPTSIRKFLDLVERLSGHSR